MLPQEPPPQVAETRWTAREEPAPDGRELDGVHVRQTALDATQPIVAAERIEVAAEEQRGNAPDHLRRELLRNVDVLKV